MSPQFEDRLGGRSSGAIRGSTTRDPKYHQVRPECPQGRYSRESTWEPSYDDSGLVEASPNVEVLGLGMSLEILS